MAKWSPVGSEAMRCSAHRVEFGKGESCPHCGVGTSSTAPVEVVETTESILKAEQGFWQIYQEALDEARDSDKKIDIARCLTVANNALLNAAKLAEKRERMILAQRTIAAARRLRGN